MLTSITPLGERGRGQRWWLTASWLLVGHLVGGALLGTVMALSGAMVRVGGFDATSREATTIIGVAVLIAVAVDLAGFRVPGRRQVDERWLTSYRGWAYGFGFGAQLGFGLVTVVNTALLGAVLTAGAVLPPSSALLLGLAYGSVRGIGASASGWVRSVGDLHRLHRTIDRAEHRVRLLGAAGAAGVAVGALVLT